MLISNLKLPTAYSDEVHFWYRTPCTLLGHFRGSSVLEESSIIYRVLYEQNMGINRADYVVNTIGVLWHETFALRFGVCLLVVLDCGHAKWIRCCERDFKKSNSITVSSAASGIWYGYLALAVFQTSSSRH